jgi:tRNA A37 methylthiotransferase MiaB
MSLQSMPLASGYLKATLLADESLSSAVDVKIWNFDGGASVGEMANALFADGCADILACSVLGWNYRAFGTLAETFKQLNPDGWVVFGGTHVANQGDRVFRMFPDVDVVVNGEGELTFRDLVRSLLDDVPRDLLGHIAGISYRDRHGRVVRTPDRPRIANLDDIPSPFLTGALPMRDEAGRYPYDVALMETNRGCPYRCAFCYWGGAIGQKVRAFTRARLRDELTMFARHQVDTVVLCDANFGMLRNDVEFVEDFIEIRRTYGFPRTLETSWAKNKSAIFYDIVRLMAEADIHSTFTLALQSLNDSALELMHRRNMRLNDWEDLACWLTAQGLKCYAQLIWGAPGETVGSFMEGYDRLSKYTTRIAVYPLLILPNTGYAERRREFDMVTVRGDSDDFEYVISHSTMTARDNQYMHRFIFWSRLIAENPVLRHTWVAIGALAGISLSDGLRSMMEWFAESEQKDAARLRSWCERSVVDPGALASAMEYVYEDAEAKRVLALWWDECMRPRIPQKHREVLDEVFRYDIVTLPLSSGRDADEIDGDSRRCLPVVEVGGDRYYVRRDLSLRCDVPGLTLALKRGDPPDQHLRELVTSVYYRAGADAFIRSTNHGQIVYFMGQPERDLLERERSAPV